MSYGYGTIYEDKKKGRWVAVVELSRARGTARRRKTFSAPTRDGAWERLEAYRSEHPAAEYPGRETLVARARARDSGGHTWSQWWALVRASSMICHYCGIKTTVHTPSNDSSHLQKDHRTPLIRGGSDLIENIVVSCRSCNTEKRSMTEGEYREWRRANHG